jgi:hypothetical protein
MLTSSIFISNRLFISVVGYFPRLVLRNKQNQYEYLGPLYVWWHGIYSLMSPSALMLKKSVLEGFYGQSKVAHVFQEAVSNNPGCSFLALPLWGLYEDPRPPIWVDTDVTFLGTKGVHVCWLCVIESVSIHVYTICAILNHSLSSLHSSSDAEEDEDG